MPLLIKYEVWIFMNMDEKCYYYYYYYYYSMAYNSRKTLGALLNTVKEINIRIII